MTDSTVSDTAPPLQDLPSVPAPISPDAPVTRMMLRDVLFVVDNCTWSSGSLRCELFITNHRPGELPFTLGMGGTSSRFDNPEGGTCIFDDVGNDYLSSGGGVANYSITTCGRFSPCTVDKTLVPNVVSSSWLRFDSVDPRATVVKLMRVKWSDGSAWAPIDFRNVPLIRK